MNRIEIAPVLLASIAVLAACGAGETAHEARTSGSDVQSRAPALLFPQDRASTFVNDHDPITLPRQGAAPSGKCLDVNDTEAAIGAGVQIWDCHGGDNQKWTYTVETSELVSLASGLCLDVVNDATHAGALLEMSQCTGELTQKWRFTNDSNVMNGAGEQLCLDVTGGSSESGTRVQIWNCHKGGNQSWKFGSSIFRSGGSGRCLDVDTPYGVPTSNVQIWDCHGQANQSWRMATGNRVVSDISNECLQPVGPTWTWTNGTPVQMAPCFGNAHTTTWWYLADGAIENAAGYCLDVDGNAPYNGTGLQLWECHGGYNQMWSTR